MLKKIRLVGLTLLDYSWGRIDRSVALRRIQEVGYSEQTAIFILEILEEPPVICEVGDRMNAPFDLPTPNGGDPDAKT